MNETYCLEYSSVQKCYHISTEEDMERNIRIANERNIQNGYYLISKHDTPLDALEAMFLRISEGGEKAVINQKEQTV